MIEKLKRFVNWDNNKTEKIIETLDHKDKDRITWTEFLEWFSNEGKIREKIHNAGLFYSGLTRIVEDINLGEGEN